MQLEDYSNVTVLSIGLNSKEDDMSRPKPGTLISKEARDVFLYDPDIIFQPKEYVGYVMRTNEDMVYASEYIPS